MKSIKSAFRKLFRVSYRLTVIVGGISRNTYSTDGKLLRKMADNMCDVEYWTIYKQGPLLLPEREIESGTNRRTSVS